MGYLGFLSYLPPFLLFIQHRYFQSAFGTWSMNNHEIQNIYSHCRVALTIKPMFKHKCKCSKLLSIFDPSSFNHPYWVGLTFSTNHDEDRPTLFPRGPIEPIALLPCCSVCIIKMCQTLCKPMFFWKFNNVLHIWWSKHSFPPSWPTTKKPWNNCQTFMNKQRQHKDFHKIPCHIHSRYTKNYSLSDFTYTLYKQYILQQGSTNRARLPNDCNKCWMLCQIKSKTDISWSSQIVRTLNPHFLRTDNLTINIWMSRDCNSSTGSFQF